MTKDNIIFIVGPTAVGKTKTAFLLAEKISGEIISCDSMQIYKELDIITAKPSKQILKKIPHHLIDEVSVEEEFDVAKFYKLTLSAIKKIHAKEKIPIIVGGSGMYMQILLEGIFNSKNKSEELRNELQNKAEQKGNEYIYNELKKLDPDAAKKIHQNDIKRIIRALEVCMTEKKPISQLQKNREGLWGKYKIELIGLNLTRELLYKRINDRVDEMFNEGAVKEVEKIKDLKLSYSVKRTIGVKEILDYLSGKIDIDRAKELIKMNTRRFAKRQLTWFRKEKRIHWITTDNYTPKNIVDIIITNSFPGSG